MIKSRLMLISLAVGVCLLTVGLGSAGLGVSGAKVVEDISPGGSISHVMKVQTRATDQPMDLLVDIFGYGQKPDGSIITLNASEDTSPYSARTFLNVSPSRFHLNPGDSQEVKLEGNIRKDVGAGGRYALVKIHSLPVGNGTITVSAGIIVPVMLTISGSKIVNKGEIRSLSLEKPFLAKNQTISLLFYNIENHDYTASVQAMIKDKSGNIVANASTTLGQPILPTYSRQVILNLPTKIPLKPGNYNLNATVYLNNGTILASKETSIEV